MPEKDNWFQRFLKIQTSQPVMPGVATSAAAFNRDIPREESTVGNDLAYTGALLASPLIGTNFVKNMVIGLPAFEVFDQLPTVFGQDRATVQGGNLLEKGFRAISPDGRFENAVAPYINQAGQVITGLPVGGLGELFARRSASGVAGALERAAQRRVANRLEYFEPMSDILSAENIQKFELPEVGVAPIVEQKVAQAAVPYAIDDLGGGYMLKSLMRGNPLEKQMGKNGTVNVNNVRALVGKGSKVEQAVVDKVLASEEFVGKKSIDYNKFRKAVQDELINYERASAPGLAYEDYGMDRIGFHVEQDPAGGSIPGVPEGATPRVLLFDSPRIPYGSGKHYYPNTLGHSRTYTTANEPDVLHVMESQSDWAQQANRGSKVKKDPMSGWIEEKNRIRRIEDTINQAKDNLANGLRPDGTPIEHEYERHSIEEFIKNEESHLPDARARLHKYELALQPEKYVQEKYLQQEYTSRQIQENLRYAAEKGQKKMRYPTRETAAKIEGYQKSRSQSLQDNPELQKKYDELRDALRTEENRIVKKYAPEDYLDESLREADFGDMGLNEEETKQLVDRIRRSEEFERSANGAKMREEIIKAREKMDPDKWLRENVKEVYLPQHETILKKYDAFPKQYQKIFKGSDVRTVTDPKGNTWYEVDVPEDYLQQEWAYKHGGLISRLQKHYGSNEKALEAVRKFAGGGPIGEGEWLVGPPVPYSLVTAGDIPMPDYNIFEDENSFKKRDAHLKSLDAFIAANPTVAGLNTADFRDVLSQFAALESSYNPKASNKSGYSGYYGLEGGSALSDNAQHRKAYEHLASLFKHNITRDDVQKGIDMGYTPAQILYKYWNQQNNATEFLQNGSAETIGNNPELGLMGNNINAIADYYRYIPEAVTDDFHVVKPGDNFSTIQERVRKPGRHYNQAGKDLKQWNSDAVVNGKLKIGDKVWFTEPYAEGGHLFETGGPESGKDPEGELTQYATLLQNYQDAVAARKKAYENYDTSKKAFMDAQDALPASVQYSPNYAWYKIPSIKRLGNKKDEDWRNVTKSTENYVDAQKVLGAATVEKYRGTNADLLQYDRWSRNEADAIKYLTNAGVRESVGAQDVADYFNSYAASPGFQRIINNQSEWGQKRHPYRKIYDSDYTKKGFVRDAEKLRETLLKNPIGTYGVFDMDSFPGMGFNYTQRATDKWPYAHIIVNSAGNPFLNQQEERFPYWEELTHEMLHDYNFVGTGQGEALDQNTNAAPGHDSRRNEKHSDLEALRFMLYKYGIYDSRGEKDATAEDIKKLREMFPKLRQFEQMDDETAAWMINHVADANDAVDMSNIAANGGKIYIKPENRGKFTALKKRTGHSASWFKAHGTPAQKKMATFALNARKWKHGDGGIIDRLYNHSGGDINKMLELIQKARSA